MKKCEKGVRKTEERQEAKKEGEGRKCWKEYTKEQIETGSL